MLIKELSQIPGVSGDESRVRTYIKGKLNEWGIKNYTDSMGNLYAVKEGKGKSTNQDLLVAAHMDEVGLMVSSIEKSGHLRFYKVGGVNEFTLVSKTVTIGPRDVMGVIGAKAVHLQKKEEKEKALKADQLFIDIGAKNKEDAEKAVQVGDYVSFYQEPALVGEKMLLGKALDNRAGCAALLEILRMKEPCGYTAVFTVQEEVGLRGATVAAYRLNPKVALVLETTTAADLLDVKEKDRATVLGAGPAFTLRDDSFITHPKVLDLLVSIAEKGKKPYQFRRYTGSYTDAGAIAISRNGVLTGIISTPCRYIHTPASLLIIDDWNHLVEIAVEFIHHVQEKGALFSNARTG